MTDRISVRTENICSMVGCEEQNPAVVFMDYFTDPDLRRLYSGANPNSHQERGIRPGHFVLVYVLPQSG